jgi:PTH1 family peptidyl-tRNA hydrolase
MHSTKVIVGLGNPEQDYDRTRHNVGFRALDYFCGKYDVEINFSDKNVDYGSVLFGDKKVFVIKPKSYMNLSGSCVKSFTQYKNIEPSNIIVIHDDIDVKLGCVRQKLAGGDAGHKGIRDIIEKLGTRDFSRIRIGIGRPDTDIEVSDWVLKRFSSKELLIIDEVLEEVALKAFDFVS